MRNLLVGVVVASAWMGVARADDVVLNCSRDNTMFESGGDLSNGVGDGVFSGRTLSAGRRRGLLRFDTSPIPAGSTVTAASLELTLLISAGTNGPGELHRVSADWGEGTSNSAAGMGAPATTGDATWTHRFYNTVTWTAAGGDFAAGASGTTLIKTAELVQTFASSAGLVADVQAWVNAPAQNFGWALLCDEGTPGNARKFASRDITDAGQRPHLRVTFTAPCAADFNHSGAVTVQDIFDFLAAYFTSSAAADINHSGSVTVQDIFDYLAAYFTGCI